MITLPFLRQIMETGLEAVKAQSKCAGLPNATVTLEGGVVNTGSRKKGRGGDWNTTTVHDDVTLREDSDGKSQAPPFSNTCSRYARWGIPLIGA